MSGFGGRLQGCGLGPGAAGAAWQRSNRAARGGEQAAFLNSKATGRTQAPPKNKPPGRAAPISRGPAICPLDPRAHSLRRRESALGTPAAAARPLYARRRRLCRAPAATGAHGTRGAAPSRAVRAREARRPARGPCTAAGSVAHSSSRHGGRLQPGGAGGRGGGGCRRPACARRALRGGGGGGGRCRRRRLAAPRRGSGRQLRGGRTRRMASTRLAAAPWRRRRRWQRPQQAADNAHTANPLRPPHLSPSPQYEPSKQAVIVLIDASPQMLQPAPAGHGAEVRERAAAARTARKLALQCMRGARCSGRQAVPAAPPTPRPAPPPTPATPARAATAPAPAAGGAATYQWPSTPSSRSCGGACCTPPGTRSGSCSTGRWVLGGWG
jgi:hypothetical protein